jgi:hypothetical protein
VLSLLAAAAGARIRQPLAAEPARADLLSAPIAVTGPWAEASPQDAARVVTRMRDVCLAGVRLVSDRQPQRLSVENHASGPPFIWLHTQPPDRAEIGVDVDPRDWCKLAYQFGHELGHVLANSWQWGAAPKPPCQWLEEAMVEAFSIHGLALLAASWGRDPPFPGNAAFAASLHQYRIRTMDGYRRPGDPPPGQSLAGWFHASRETLDRLNGLYQPEGPMILTLAAAYGRDAALITDIGALNRWPERSAVPIEDYLRLWRKSCAELGAAGRLPALLARELRVAT